MKEIALFLIFIHASQSAKILGIFPTPSISHQFVFRTLMKDLADRGHELVILTPVPFKTDNPNVTQIDLHSSYEILRREFNFVDIKNNNVDEAGVFSHFFPVMMNYFEEQLSHPEVKKLIADRNSNHFDVIIMEVLTNYPMLAFAEIFDAPVIEFTSVDTINFLW
ncbi:hypothetical protein ACKWTF_003055 [Chironomus riparius]